MNKKYYWGLLGLMLTAGCAVPGLTGPNPKDKIPVVFSIAVDKSQFDTDGKITVRVYNPEDLKRLAETADCAVSYNAETGKETSSCPDAALPDPEVFYYPMATLNPPLEVQAKQLFVGEKYQVQISGMSRDGCNTTSAQHEALATESPIFLNDLPYATTERACLPPE